MLGDAFVSTVARGGLITLPAPRHPSTGTSFRNNPIACGQLHRSCAFIGSVSRDGGDEGTKEPHLIPGIPRVKFLAAAFPQPIMVLRIAMRLEPLRGLEVTVAVAAGERHIWGVGCAGCGWESKGRGIGSKVGRYVTRCLREI